jgi:MFS transporter, ACS family, glucarate transporter
MKMTRQQILIVVTLLFIGSFANMDKSMIGLSVTAVAKDFHLQPSQTGIILSIFYVSFIAVTLPGGWFVDRYGYRMFILVSLGILAIGSFLFGAVSGLAALVLVRLFVGFGRAQTHTGATGSEGR